MIPINRYVSIDFATKNILGTFGELIEIYLISVYGISNVTLRARLHERRDEVRCFNVTLRARLHERRDEVRP